MLIRYRDHRGSAGSPTALMIACNNGDIGIVTILLRAGADVNAHNTGGADALNYAARDVDNHGCAIIILLSDYGAHLDPNTRSGRDTWVSARYKPNMQDALRRVVALQKARARK